MLYTALLICIITINFILGLFVFAKNPKNHVNISFSLFILFAVLWMGSNYLSNQPFDYRVAFIFNKLIFIFASFISLALLYFAIVFPKNGLKITVSKAAVLFIPVLISNWLVLSNKIITGITSQGDTTGVIFGPFIWYYTAQFSIYLLASLAFMLKHFFNSAGYAKAQLQYLLLGIFTTTILGLITNLALPLTLNMFGITNYGPLFTSIMVISTAYAIIRHRLLDIRLVVARSVAYTLLVTLLATLYTGIVFLISHFVFMDDLGGGQALVYSLVALFVAFTFQPLKNILEKLTDKIFFKGGYNSNDLLSRLTKIMATTLKLGDLTTQTLHMLLNSMHISKGTFMIMTDHSIYPVAAEGFAVPPIFDQAISQWLASQKKLMVFEEESDEVIKQKMREMDVSVVLPLFVGEKIHGLLVLGEKLSGEIYSEQDIEVLQIFGPEISVAVQNSKSYDEIQRFNITLRQEVERATHDLQIANEKLKELDELKDDFVSIASHELRTPMTAIRSYAWMALNRADVPLSDKLKKYLQRTLTSTERLINLVNDMLNISRIESGRIEIVPESFDIEQFAKEVMAEVEVKARERNLHLEVIQAGVPKVFADPDKVHQVLLNLLGNAIKFTPENGQVRISFFSDGSVVEVSVKDSGVGIAKEDLPRLFKKFGRLDNSYVAAATSGGTGLGLYISKSLIEFMGGQIWADSEGENKGTTFTFTLPVSNQQVLENREKYTKRVAGGDTKVLEPVAI